MNENALIESSILEATGKRFELQELQAISGGCINDAFLAIGSGSDRFFIKTNRHSFLPIFEAEAEALREIRDTANLRVPEVITVTASEHQALLVLEYIPARRSRTGDWRKLGKELAKLHETRKSHFGWTRDNWIGASEQPNPPSSVWLDFFRSHRLEHQLALCRRKGFELIGEKRLMETLDEFFEDHQPFPSLLHGDLWSGNVGFDDSGQPFTYDPSSYYGDREADIAFSEFFGGFAADFYDAYGETFPLDPGYERRKTLYNLYHCLNHVNLFGGSYTQQAQEMADQLLSR